MGSDESVTLYHFEDPGIKIDVIAYFENDRLVIDGYDIGDKVKIAWGDSDYEYVMKVDMDKLAPLYAMLHVKVGDQMGLLQAIAKRFHGHGCFSKLREFFNGNRIEYDSFSWT